MACSSKNISHQFLIMAQELIFVTHNKHKYKEIQAIIPQAFHLVSLADIGIFEEIPETADTMQGNALQKARFVHKKSGKSCFADDTGLEVDALDGAPGVYSARYAGEQCSYEDNNRLLLKNLEKHTNRRARFRTVIALIIDGKEYLFEGIVPGEIIRENKGRQGFGYDPVFVPDGFGKTYAQMSDDEKNAISHRAKAVNKMIDFLEKL